MTAPEPDVAGWAARFLPVSGVLPGYGSPAWLALPDEDPRKLGAAVAAAETFRRLAPMLTEAVEVIAQLEDALADQRAARAEAAAALDVEVRATVAQVAARLTRRDPAPRPMVQTEDWPTLVVAGDVPVDQAQPDPETPTSGPMDTAAMIRRLAG